MLSKEQQIFYASELGVVIMDNQRTAISTEAVTLLLAHEVLVLFCDAKNMPIGLLSSELGYSRKLEVLRLQLAMNQKIKNRLWQKIVKQKIKNQWDVVMYYRGLTASEGVYVQDLISNVQEGDITGREAVFARKYMPICFGGTFTRQRHATDAINQSLNYGYAILRAVIRKQLVCHGFEPSLGIHHDSGENPFNLSDDIIEPYRPFVDALVIEGWVNVEKNTFEQSDKPTFIQAILTTQCLIEDRVHDVYDAIELTILSLRRCFDKNSASGLSLPKVIEP